MCNIHWMCLGYTTIQFSKPGYYTYMQKEWSTVYIYMYMVVLNHILYKAYKAVRYCVYVCTYKKLYLYMCRMCLISKRRRQSIFKFCNKTRLPEYYLYRYSSFCVNSGIYTVLSPHGISYVNCIWI